MKWFPVVLLTVLMTGRLSASVAPKDQKEFNIQCPSVTLCPLLKDKYQQCKKGGTEISCGDFLRILSSLFPEYDCQRNSDHSDGVNYIVPALWVCPERQPDNVPYMDLYFDLLSKLPFHNAQMIFGSENFRSILDGEYAEEYLEKSQMIENKLKAASKP